MKTEVEDSGPCRKVLNVEVAPEQVRAAHSAVVEEYRREARVDGFRPGRAPPEIVARKFAESIREDVRNRLAREAYDRAVAESKAAVFELVDFKADDFTAPDVVWKASYTVDLEPDFALPSYKGLNLPRQPIEISEADVDRVLEGIQNDRATFEDVTGRPAASGDMVCVDFSGLLDGRPVEEAIPESKGLGKAADFWVHLGEHSFMPGFVEALTGAAIGDTRSIESVFPDDFPVAALRGRTVQYEVKVKGLRQRVLPDLSSPAFLESVRAASLEELRNRVRDNLRELREQQEERRLRDEAVNLLLSATPTDLPSREIERVSERMIREIVESLHHQGLTEEQIRSQSDKILASARQSAARSVHSRFVLERIAREEGIEATAHEVDAEIRDLARVQGEDPAALRRRIEEDDALDNVRRAIVRRKALDFIIANAKVNA